MEDLTGYQIKGYELREQIGVGGYGAVYRAHQAQIQREVAIKIILPHYANHPDFIRRFEAEAHLVARLEHPHIVPLYDYWREPDGAYLVMRWLRGGSLHNLLTGTPWKIERLLQILDEIGAALMVAHRHGVVHRDLKPANILLDEDGNAYLADFGIAKDLGNVYQTDHTAVMGSPAYISPEQIKAEQISPQTDIYSLGVMIYEILTGALPFESPTPIALLFKHIHEPMPPLQTLRPDLPEAVNTVIQRATAKNPADRYPDVLRMVIELRHALGSTSPERARSVGRTTPTVTDRRPRDGQDTTGGRSAYETVVINRTALLEAIAPAVENPYKGLRAFQEADASDFFGREALTGHLLARLAEKSEFERFLAVVGPSGGGKSSVVRAGLIPALRRGALPGSQRWFVVEMIPGPNPLQELESALLRVAVNRPANLLERLREDDQGLLHAVQRLLPGGAETELVLVIDQFEEVFTLLEDEAARTHFLNSLRAAVTDPRSRLRLIITLRADFYDRPLLYSSLSEMVRQRTEVVVPLAPEELQHAIAGPARRVGLFLEPDLVAAIIHDVGEQPGALPLLQYALTELFERRKGRTLTLEAYHASGGVLGALARRADEIYTELNAAEQEAARQLFLRLVTLGEGTEDTRRRVHLLEIGDWRSEIGNSSAISNLQSPISTVIDLYSKYRLLTLDRDPVTRDSTVEVAHEALIRTWSRLRDWLDASRDDVRLHRRLASAATEWANAGREGSFLARGARLEQFAGWAAESRLALNAQERSFLDASLAEREARRAQETARKAHEVALERRSRNFLRALVGVSLAAAVVALALAGLAFSQRQVAVRAAAAEALAKQEALSNAEAAESARQVAQTNEERAELNAQEAQQNAAEARNLALSSGAQAAVNVGNTDLALALALAGNSLEPSLPQEQFTLAEAAYAPGTRRIFRGHTDVVQSVAFTPDGTKALSGSNDQTLLLWDLATGEVIRRFEGHTDQIASVAITPDGSKALSGSNDTTMILWDLATGQIIHKFEGHTDEVQGVEISPDGRRALSSSQDSLLILWDLETGQEIRRLTGHTQEVKNAAFSADGRTAISCSADATMILWDLETGQIIRKYEGLTREINDIVLSKDGRQLFSGTVDGLGVLWDVETGRELRRFPGHIDEIRQVAFSPDGRTAAAGSIDATIIVWDVETGAQVRLLAGHGAAVRTIAYSPDGHSLISGSQDSTLRLWNLDGGAELRRFEGHTDEAARVAFSPDGKTAVSGSSDQQLIMWNVDTGVPIQRLAGHEGSIQGVAYSPDGKSIISASNDGLLILWDAQTGQFIRKFEGHERQATSVAFHPDGKRVLSGSTDRTLILWDVATAQPIRKFEGHEQAIRTVAIRPDGRTALSGGVDTVLILWDIETGQAIRRFEGHTATIRYVSFSPDGSKALSGSDDKTLRMWNVETGELIRLFPQEHNGAVRSAVFSPDGKFILSSSADTTMIMWDAETGDALRRFTGHQSGVQDVAWSPDGHTALSASHDALLILWRIDSQAELIDWTRANRYIPPLSCDQVERYELEMTCEDVAASAPNS